MQVESTAMARLRAREVAPATFRKLSVASVVGLSAGLVMAHFLLAVAMLGLAVAVANEALRIDLGPSPPLVPPFLRRAGLVLAVAACGLVTTGAFATASGPHPGAKKEIKRIFTVEGTVYVHVRLTAVFGILFLVILLTLAWRRQGRLLALAGGLLVL